MADSTEGSSAADGEEATVISPDEIARPGEEDANTGRKSSDHLNKWHNFESQYSLAIEQSTIVERESWGSSVEFLMSCIASAVGLGNIWRFPFVAGRNGGAAFLVPYMVVLLLVARPIYLMELGLGQFTSGGPIKVWEMCPAFRGVGYTVTIASFYVAVFYCNIMGWSILYAVYSLIPTFPWSQSNQSFPFLEPQVIPFFGNDTYSTGPFFGLVHLQADLGEFKAGEGLGGPPIFHLAMGLLFSWLLVWLQMVFGVAGSGKVAYFTALFPYVVLSILFILGLTLEHSGAGLYYLFVPNEPLAILKPQAWFEAVAQCFFSLGITFGGCFSFASFNRFHHKLKRDIWIISLMDTLTSLLAASCMFMLIGQIAGGDPEQIAKIAEQDGAAMAFIQFPNVLLYIGSYPWPHMFSFLFFFMILVLGVGSANGLVSTVVTAVCDANPKWKRSVVVTVVSIICFGLGIIICTPGGNTLIDILDKHGSEIVIYTMAIFESIGVFYVYGVKNLSNDLQFMLGSSVNVYWIVCWISTPILLSVIWVSYLLDFTFNKDFVATITKIICWFLTIGTILIVPGIAVWVIITRKSSKTIKKIKASFFPTRKWGPSDPVIREAWRRWKQTQPNQLKVTTWLLNKFGLQPPGHDHHLVPPSPYQSVMVKQDDSRMPPQMYEDNKRGSVGSEDYA